MFSAMSLDFRFLNKALAEEYILFFEHDPKPSVAHYRK